ncbi:unnamed protein product [Rotaria sordida]|uniref:F-box domain-containing protein n=1 Tax=Rotaria sordida TaxID=392033 RepID=A0A814G7W4_9BILA|nr:unnamed protein product [Rotaria sordida]CAF1405886.1 unnamed protein product [Rotaria sordida]
MEYPRVQLNDLLDEILMIILKKLSHVQVLCSLIGVNKRLNKTVHDSIFTNRLTLMVSFLNHCIFPLSESILDRFCLQILPKIHDKIEWLDLEAFSMERILRATNFPNLYGFGLYNIRQEIAMHLFNEELDLSLIVSRKKIFIDGYDLKTNIINNMTLLNKFTFNICSLSHFYNQIISCIDYFQKRNYGQCHIYSYPYKLKYYDNITNNFPGGIFKCVREISLFDERPFEHEFFLQIQKSFPLMEKLTLINKKPQINKFNEQSKDDNRPLSIVIQYPHLFELNLIKTHEDYLEQFLLDTKMCLPNSIFLHINYRLLKEVTHNFTRNSTRNNCVKIRVIFLYNTLGFPEHLKDYFPHAKICSL